MNPQINTKQEWFLKLDAYDIDYIVALINPELVEESDCLYTKKDALDYFKKKFEEHDLYSKEFRQEIFK